MLRTIITTGAAMLLSLAVLAACEVDTADDSDGGDGADEVEETTTSEEEESDETVTEEESSDSSTPEDDGDAETPTETDDGETATPEDEPDETATGGEEESEVTEEGDESAAGDTVEVTLSEFDIEVETPLETGEAVLSVTNESEGLLGLAIERDAGSDEEEGDEEDSVELIHAINVEAGETRELEVNLESGEYTFFCPIGELRETEDMETDVTVE